jgi:signal transduction histidine kinase
MTQATFSFMTAATHFVPALLWGTIAWDVWHYLRHRRPQGAFPRVVLALTCLTTLHYATWTITALLRTHLQTRSWLRGTLMATTDASVITLIALARHVGVLWGRRPGTPEPSVAWLAVNYGVCAVALALTVLWELFVLQIAGLSAYALFSTYLLVLGVAVVFDFRRGAARGTWRPGGLWQARTADVVVLAVALVFVAIQQLIPLAVGSTALQLLLGPEASGLALLLFAANGVGALLFATPFVVRNLGDLLPAFLTALGATAAVLVVHTTARAATIGRSDPEVVALIDLAATVVIVFAVMPLRTWLHGIAGRMLFRRGRLRWAELHAVVHALPPEAGVVECCRRMLEELMRVMQLRGAAVLLRDGRTIATGAIDVTPLERGWPRDGAGVPDHPLLAIHFRDLPPAVSDVLTAADVLAVLPITSPRRQWGWVFVTTDLRGASFGDDDDAAVAAATDQAALTLDAADLLARTVEVERALAHAEKLAAIGELAARFAHEIRNPVTAARSLAQQLARDPTSALNAEHAGVILEELERVERQVRELLRFARRDELALAPTDVSTLVRTTAHAFADRLAAGGIDLGLDITDGVVARADGEKVRRVLVNLIENAMDALQNGRPEKHLALAVARDGERALVRVADDGAGIPIEAQASVFDPFVSLKPSGTGLGLAIAKRIVDAHGGSITLTSRPGATAFEIRLPLGHEAGS